MKKLLLIPFLLFSLVSFSAGKVTSYPRENLLTFRGLDDTSSLLTVQDGRAQDLQNVKLSISNSLKKRNGYGIINGVSNHLIGTEYFPAVTGLYHSRLSSGTDFRLAVIGERLYYDTASAWTLINGANITYDQDYQFVWVTALDEIVFTNDVNPPMKWDGSGSFELLDVSDLSDTLTKAKVIAWFKNYLIFGNTVENSIERPTRIRWSNVGTVETFSDDDFIDIAALGGQEINASIELYDNVYILMTDSIWKATLVGGDEILVINKVVDNVGCIAKNSVQTINLLNQTKGIVFLSKDKKVYFFDGTNLVDISTLISVEMSGLRADRLKYAVSANDGTSYFLAVTTGNALTTNNLLLEFQYEMGEWTKHIQIDANAMFQVVDSDSLSKVWFGNYDSFIYELETTDDSDITGQTDGVSSIGVYNLPNSTATGLQMILTDTAIDYTATGATVSITAGTGINEEKVIVYHTSTGLVVDSDFTTSPDSSSLFSIGAIDAFYETKWYDMGEPMLRKGFVKTYLWAEEEGGVSVSAEQSIDFASVLNTESISLQGEGGLWGVGLWGVMKWGGEEALFKEVQLNGEGRFVKLRFENDEIDEPFNLLGFNFNYRRYDIQ